MGDGEDLSLNVGLIAVMVFELILLGATGTGSERGVEYIPTAEEPVAPAAPTATPTVTTTPAEYPRPDYVPTLRKYEINKDDDIWKAEDPSSYIEPGNEWVQYCAKTDMCGIIYLPDSQNKNLNYADDYWQNADYTLIYGYGDCEDMAIAQTSIDIAKGKKAVVVAGYVTLDNGQRIRDLWEEVYSDGIKSIKGDNPAIMEQKELRIEPMFMFNDKITWGSYDENWHNN